MKIPFLKPRVKTHFKTRHIETAVVLDGKSVFNVAHDTDRGVVQFYFAMEIVEYYPKDAVQHLRDIADSLTKAALTIEGENV